MEVTAVALLLDKSGDVVSKLVLDRVVTQIEDLDSNVLFYAVAESFESGGSQIALLDFE